MNIKTDKETINKVDSITQGLFDTLTSFPLTIQECIVISSKLKYHLERVYIMEDENKPFLKRTAIEFIKTNNKIWIHKELCSFLKKFWRI